VVTGRSYRIFWSDPGEISNWLQPTGAYPWTVEDQPEVNVTLDWMGNCVEELKTVDFSKAHPEQYIAIRSNIEILTSLQSNPLYRSAVSVWEVNAWFAKFFPTLFQPTPRVMALAAPILNAMHNREVICVQARVLGKQWPQLPKAKSTPALDNEDGDDNDDGSISGLSSLWDFVARGNASHQLFVTSDCEEVVHSAEHLFPQQVLSMDGPVVHFDKSHLGLYEQGEFARGLDRVVAEFVSFQGCQSFVFSRSGFGELGAATMPMHPDRKRFLWTGEEVYRFHPDLFAFYKNVCHDNVHNLAKTLQVSQRCTGLR